ncbi:MAG TPA: Mpo1-like protein [Myxococcales bacterium]|nr:Mpo1-like protein [Myxococcales bacterium]
MNARTVALLDQYADSHRHPTNRLTHKIAIPLIVFHILAMLDWVRLAPAPALPGGVVTLGMAFWAATAVWYLRADVKLGLLVIGLSVLAFPIGRALPWWSVVAVAVVGWLVQLAGHVVWEKKQPSFLTNMVHALVGPLFFMAVLTRAYRPGQRAAAAA